MQCYHQFLTRPRENNRIFRILKKSEDSYKLNMIWNMIEVEIAAITVRLCAKCLEFLAGKRKTRLKWLSVSKDAQWITYLTGMSITITMISYNKIIICPTIRSNPNNIKDTAHSWAQPKNTYVDLNCPVKSLAWLAQHTRWKHIWKMQSPMQVVLKSRKQVVEFKSKLYMPSTVNTDYMYSGNYNWFLMLSLFPPQKVHFQAKVDTFLNFMFINLLVYNIQTL